MKGIPHRLIKTRCRYCGRMLRYAHLPNRGSVMVHEKGAGARCRDLRARGRDAVSMAAALEERAR